MFAPLVTLALVATTSASLLWDGRLNNYTDASFLSLWSWSNPIGPYQYYIHGSGSVSDYVVVSPDYKNPDDSTSTQGLQISIDNTSSWNGQTMMRTELIPQTTAAINAGKLYYHFSIHITETNPPSQTEEHQICFFESHFTELKYGGSSNDNVLQWMANSESQWNTTLSSGIWHNIAYGIDFDAQTVTFYHSTGGDELVLTAGPISAATTSDGKDWHLGVLRLPGSSGASGIREDWHFSGVYIEDGDLTTTISNVASENSTSSIVPSAAMPVAKIANSSTTLQTMPIPTPTPNPKTTTAWNDNITLFATATTPASPSSTASCPALGTTDSLGRYSCNPAHAYPTGQSCEIVDGCYYLVDDESAAAGLVATDTTEEDCE